MRQFDWWQSVEIDGISFTATPAQHFSGRSLFDGNSTLWASWVIVDDDLRVFFSGDTGYFDGFKTIGERLGPFNVALVETGAYDAQWPYVHMQPDDTVQAHVDLRAHWLVPIHNGTFDLAMHRWYEPFERVIGLAAARGIAISTPRMGERLSLDHLVDGFGRQPTNRRELLDHGPGLGVVQAVDRDRRVVRTGGPRRHEGPQSGGKGRPPIGLRRALDAASAAPASAPSHDVGRAGPNLEHRAEKWVLVFRE